MAGHGPLQPRLKVLRGQVHRLGATNCAIIMLNTTFCFVSNKQTQKGLKSFLKSVLVSLCFWQVGKKNGIWYFLSPFHLTRHVAPAAHVAHPVILLVIVHLQNIKSSPCFS